MVIETEVVGAQRSNPEYNFFASSIVQIDTPEFPTFPQMSVASQLGAMARFCRERGWTLIAVVFPDLGFLGEPYPFDAIHHKLAVLFEELGVTSIDLTAAFQERGAAELRVHAMDAHPNEIGHAFAADALMPVLAPLAKTRTP